MSVLVWCGFVADTDPNDVMSENSNVFYITFQDFVEHFNTVSVRWYFPNHERWLEAHCLPFSLFGSPTMPIALCMLSQRGQWYILHVPWQMGTG